ncbi:peptidoglycan DD-metalloendopeptidase family protein [Lactobacillus sp. 3B(2020)]|uniref:peptidoglycan DD-metalloendopeptidase family protein n=1 Tax=Lactobacillus sp. 3B(2020) TaxID=2695882 RepID=UPI0015E51082|nr:peptidoglycan DD-metalloendopeptidase family protein [Lactobacillus sp. 3B(2020)]QLL69462.1 peptidoglycan DD-metalloendopeptidase family protein [Lactobacillus sp. 3B(2020)]
MGKPSQDMKRHFKMYKKGKLWLVAGITAASLFAGVHGAKADTTATANQANKVTTTTGNANSSDDSTVISTAVQSASTNAPVASQATVSSSASQSQSTATSSAQVTLQVASQATNASSASASQVKVNAAVATTSSATTTPSSATQSSQSASVESAAVQTKEVYSGGHWYLQNVTTHQNLSGWQSLSANRLAYYSATNNQMQYGEQLIDGKWYYLNTIDGDVATGWKKLNDGREVYYDVKKGTNSVSGQGMLHGMQKTQNGTYYYFNNETGAEETGFKKVNGKTYYFAPSMVKGERYINGHFYDFNNETGVMATSFTKLPDGRTVYYNNQGQMQYGEHYINGYWYNFDKSTGKMATSFTKLADGRVVYYNAQGQMQHGIVQVENNTYYFDHITGAEKTNLVAYNSSTGKLQYFGTDGALVKNGKVGSVTTDANGYLNLADGENYIAGNWYLTKDGKVVTGFQTISANRTVYYDPSTAAMVHGEAYIDGHFRFFNQSTGAMATGFTKLSDGRTVYYNTKGEMQYGEHYIDGHFRFFNRSTGAMATSFTKLPDGRTVYYNTKGEMQYGWQTINNNTYYFDTSTGAMYTGTHKIDGKTYTFDNNGVEEAWGWPFPADGQGSFTGAQLFGVNAGGEFRLNGFHDGLDFGSIDHPGTTVHAIHAGTVTGVGYIAGLDWYVTVDTGEYMVVYQEAFSSRSQIAVKVGQTVGLGDTIGYRNAAHLHIGITRQKNLSVALASSFLNNGTWLNPLTIIKNNG